MLRIAEVTLHGCIRAHKQAWCLAEANHNTHFLAAQIAPSHSANAYTTLNIFYPWTASGGVDPIQLANAVKLVSPQVDLFHVHNEPNWIFRVVKENTDKPVVFDIHDWTSLRKINEPVAHEVEEEEYALEHADAFVVPSRGYLKKIRKESSKPSTLVYSMVPKWLFPKVSQPGDGLAYAGGVKGGTAIHYNYAYRDWSGFAQEAVKRYEGEISFFCANGGEDLRDYEHERIKVYPPHRYDEMINALSHYGAGLVGSPIPLQDFEDSMPNKLFEYLSAGLPCIVINAPEAKRFVEEHGLGVGIQDASEVAEAMNSLKDHSVSRDRWEFTMESQIPKLLALYEEVLCKRQPRYIAQLGTQVESLTPDGVPSVDVMEDR